MTDFVALHGAFRGPWYWEPLASELERRGHRLHAVDLVGESLQDWIDRTVSTAAECSGEVVLVGHSMGGMVAQASVPLLGDRPCRLVLLDSPLIDTGLRAVDVSGPEPPDPDMLAPREFQIPPSPVGAEQGFVDTDLADWVNERLRPVPMGPQLDPAPPGTGRPDGTTIVFFSRTPDGFPSTFARRRCESDGIAHSVIDGFHDAPVLDPSAVAEALIS